MGDWRLGLTSQQGTLTAIIELESGYKQIVSLKREGREYLHGGGKPHHARNYRESQGWKNSEKLMFPVVGATLDNQLTVNDTEYLMCQHGFAQFLSFRLETSSGHESRFAAEYEANTPIPNGRKKSDRDPDNLSWGWSVRIGRQYNLLEDRLRMEWSITNLSDTSMPYDTGWHPAAWIRGTLRDGYVQEQGSSTENHSLGKIRKESKEGAILCKTNRVVLYDAKGDRILSQVEVSSNLPNTMLWSPSSSSLVCLEPVTGVTRRRGFDKFETEAPRLEPGKKQDYWTEIKVA